MFVHLFAIPAPLTTATAFLVGGAAGVLLTRLARSQRGNSSLSLIDTVAPAAAPARIAASTRGASPQTPQNGAVARVERLARLPLPQRDMDDAPGDSGALALVDAFVDRLAQLPAREWIEVGRNELADAGTADRRTTACAMLEATIGAQGLGVAAWYARDAVETAAFLATDGARKWTTADRRAFAAAHHAAEKAAAALLTHALLSPADLATLLAPFERLVPRDDVSRLTTSRELDR